MTLFYNIGVMALKAIFKVFYRHRVYGLEHVCQRRAIIAPNHSSFLDPPLIGVSWPKEVSFLARKSLFSSFFWGPIINHLNAYPVEGTAQDLSSIRLICQLLNQEHQVVIFPTGLRSSDGTLGEIKAGIGMLAMRCNAPITPVYIAGSFAIWNRHHYFPRLYGKTACVIGSPIHCKDFKHLDKKAAQELIGEQVRKSLESLHTWYDNGAQGVPP